MNISLFISSLYGGGAERVTCNLASYLAEHGHNVEILTMSETDKSYKLSKSVSVKTLLPLNERRNKLWNTIIRFPRLWKYLIKHKDNDVYIVMLPKTTIMLLMFKWMTKAKIIASERSVPQSYPSKLVNILKFYAKKADGWVFQTDETREWYESHINNVKKTVIPNAINYEFLVEINNVKKEPIIISTGRLSTVKNYEMLIRAFKLISDKHPNYKLVIYGEGREKTQLHNLILKLGLEKKAFLPGNVADIANRYKKASVFALSSNYEGMPNALIEAMALGLPCVSTDCPCGGPNFLISSGENGILVPVNDTNKFAMALDRIISSEVFAKSLGSEAIKVRDRLNPDKIYAQWESFIIKVLSA